MPQTVSFGTADGTVVHWRSFLRALAEEVDARAGAPERNDLLRCIGARMARLLPLPAVHSLETLEIEINDALAAIGWGQARLLLNEAERVLSIAHSGMPRIGSAGSPPGTWLAPALEGLYETWLAQQPGSEPGLQARLQPSSGGETVVLRYARALP